MSLMVLKKTSILVTKKWIFLRIYAAFLLHLVIYMNACKKSNTTDCMIIYISLI